MTTVLSPYLKQRFVDANGAALYLGTVSTFAAGTNTPIVTYKDSLGIATNTNPITLNPRGECDLWMQPNVAYKVTVADQLGNLIWTIDNIVNSQLITLYAGVDTGVANAYILNNFLTPVTGYQDGLLIYWVPSHTNTTVSTMNLNGYGVVSIVNPDGSALVANELLQNAMIGMVYRGGSFYLATTPGSIPLSGTFAGTPTGFAGIAPVTVKYVVNGQQVTLTIPYFNGTSNAITMTMTGLPASLQPLTRVMYPLALGMDNGVNINNILAQLEPGSGTITFWKSASAGAAGWTNGGAKGAGVLIGGIFQYSNTLTYSLI